MTPGAHYAAAIVILSQVEAGQSAEQALTRWARASRFAGSKDRAAIRDIVFDILRHWRSDAVRGGAQTARGRVIGHLRAQGIAPETIFDGKGYAPDPLSAAEITAGQKPQSRGEVLDLPDWLVREFDASLGADADETALAMTLRAPVTLRVNIARTDLADMRAALAADGIETVENERADTALTITHGARRLRQSHAYTSGLVELQDASSQAAVAAVTGIGRALDYCAGGGGKALALAAAGWTVTAHDVDPKRMRDLPARAERGGHRIKCIAPDDLEPDHLFDVVFCDAPCSGSGTWRRTPEAKWALNPEKLNAYAEIQAEVLEAAHVHVVAGGRLYYATCSVLDRENARQIRAFCSCHPEWHCVQHWSWPVDASGDGFYLAELRRV